MGYISPEELLKRIKSPEFKLESSLKRGVVYKLRLENDPTFSSSAPHWWVVLNKDPKSNEIIIASCATSRSTPRVRANNSQFPERYNNSIVEVEIGGYVEFRETTLIDCNNIRKFSKGDLVQMVKNKKLEICKEVSEILLNSIIVAARSSPTVDSSVLTLL